MEEFDSVQRQMKRAVQNFDKNIHNTLFTFAMKTAALQKSSSECLASPLSASSVADVSERTSVLQIPILTADPPASTQPEEHGELKEMLSFLFIAFMKLKSDAQKRDAKEKTAAKKAAKKKALPPALVAEAPTPLLLLEAPAPMLSIEGPTSLLTSLPGNSSSHDSPSSESIRIGITEPDAGSIRPLQHSTAPKHAATPKPRNKQHQRSQAILKRATTRKPSTKKGVKEQVQPLVLAPKVSKGGRKVVAPPNYADYQYLQK